MKGARVLSEAVLPDQVPDFKDIGTGDFDGDGQSDILWHNPTTSEARLWLMQGTKFKSAVPLPTAPPNSRLSAVADFNGDGNPDIWWYSESTGQSTLWLMDHTSVQTSATPPRTRVRPAWASRFPTSRRCPRCSWSAATCAPQAGQTP